VQALSGGDEPLRLMDTSRAPSAEGNIDPDQQQARALAVLHQELSRANGPVVVRVRAVGRFFEGDPVIAAISTVPNRVVYTRGQTIATTALNGKEPEKLIRNEVAAFLATKVRPAAINAGILPDAQNQISTDVLDKILDLTREIHLRQRPVQVVARAAQDTWSAQPLDLTFQVE